MRLLFFALVFCLTTSGIAQAIFPLSVSENQRYLVDAEGKPFLYQADTPWFLFFKLTLPEVREYMQARKEQGFNTLQIMLRSEEHTSELQSQSTISYAVFCLKKKKKTKNKKQKKKKKKNKKEKKKQKIKTTK